MKKVFSILLVCTLLLGALCFQGCVKQESIAKTDVPESTGNDTAEMIMAEFEKLAAIPRRSKNEKAVSDYLVSRAKEMGLSVVQDEHNNVIVEKPASDGYESLPLTILQSHIDMVCVADDGFSYNPETDPIKIIRDGNKIYADGTSLGADDGIGVSIVLCILGGEYSHGPLRAIFTTDEEGDMSGAAGLDAKYLMDAKYLLNVDWEDSASLCTSSADATTIELSFVPEWGTPVYEKAYTVEVKGLAGGHSGLEINKGHANAIRLVASYLQSLSNQGVEYELAEFSGGTAKNSIPTSAKAVFTIRESDSDKASRLFDEYHELCTVGYAGIEDKMVFTLTDVEAPERVLKNDCDMAGFLVSAPLNVHTMSPAVDGLVESSSNIGLITGTDNKIGISVFSRSSSNFFSNDLIIAYETMAKRFGLEFTIISSSPGWAYRSSELVPLMEQIYLEQNGTEILNTPIHAGLECGWFVLKNPDLDIVSIGPKIDYAHSSQETLYYDSIPVTFNLLTKTLKDLKN